MALISTHNLIINNPQRAPRYLVAQGQAISHFEDMFRLPRNDNMHAYIRIWETLPHSLKIRECQWEEVEMKSGFYKQEVETIAEA